MKSDILVGHQALKQIIESNLSSANRSLLRCGFRPPALIVPLDRGEGRSTLLCYMAKEYEKAGAVPLTGSQELFIEYSAKQGFSSETLLAEIENAGVYCTYNGVFGCCLSSVCQYMDASEMKAVAEAMKSISRQVFLILFTASKMNAMEEKMIRHMSRGNPSSIIQLEPYVYSSEDLADIMSRRMSNFQFQPYPISELRALAEALPQKTVKCALESLGTMMLQRKTNMQWEEKENGRRALVVT